MTAFYLASASDVPHVQHPYSPATTACGRPMVGMWEITATQVLVWLRDARCMACKHRLEQIARGNR